MNYLFIGEDELSKDIKLQKIKQELRIDRLESFNIEILHSKNLDLKTLQEKLLLLPVKTKKRLILIRDASNLGADIKQYLIGFLKKPYPHVGLILDTRHIEIRDRFFNQVSRFVRIVNFHQSKQIDAFTLAREIVAGYPESRIQSRQKRIKSAMRLLHRLLLQKERPEKILGAIRYQLEHERMDINDRRKRLTFLLNCDTDIKTGRIKSELALEWLLIRLCFS